MQCTHSAVRSLHQCIKQSEQRIWIAGFHLKKGTVILRNTFCWQNHYQTACPRFGALLVRPFPAAAARKWHLPSRFEAKPLSPVRGLRTAWSGQVTLFCSAELLRRILSTVRRCSNTRPNRFGQWLAYNRKRLSRLLSRFGSWMLRRILHRIGRMCLSSAPMDEASDSSQSKYDTQIVSNRHAESNGRC